MEFNEALKKLCIEDYAERIFKSNSNGELFHLRDYIIIAEVIENETSWFRNWFISIVEDAEKNWNRPESIFQHVLKILIEQNNTI